MDPNQLPTNTETPATSQPQVQQPQQYANPGPVSPSVYPTNVIQASNNPPGKRRAYFWLLAPTISFIVGFTISLVNGLITVEIVHLLGNIAALLLIGFGIFGFIPGLIYGFVLLNKK
jgi:hypothetical protein